MSFKSLPNTRYLNSLCQATKYYHPNVDVNELCQTSEEIDEIIIIMRLNTLFSQKEVQRILAQTEYIIYLKNTIDELEYKLKKNTPPNWKE